MKLIIKNSSLVFQSLTLHGWQDVTNNTSIVSTVTGSYYKNDGTLTESHSFSCSTILRGDATKVRSTAFAGTALAIMIFRDSSNNMIGSPITMQSEGLGNESGIFTVEKEFPSDAVKVDISYSHTPASRMEGFKLELYYQ